MQKWRKICWDFAPSPPITLYRPRSNFGPNLEIFHKNRSRSDRFLWKISKFGPKFDRGRYRANWSYTQLGLYLTKFGAKQSDLKIFFPKILSGQNFRTKVTWQLFGPAKNVNVSLIYNRPLKTIARVEINGKVSKTHTKSWGYVSVHCTGLK